MLQRYINFFDYTNISSNIFIWYWKIKKVPFLFIAELFLYFIFYFSDTFSSIPGELEAPRNDDYTTLYS